MADHTLVKKYLLNNNIYITGHRVASIRIYNNNLVDRRNGCNTPGCDKTEPIASAALHAYLQLPSAANVRITPASMFGRFVSLGGDF
jgi:hypothetical protein